MANLRSLIHYADKERFSEIVGAASSTTAYSNHGSEYKQIKWFGPFGQYFHSRQCWDTCMVWQAPAGTKYVKFEIWGGGGGTGGFKCCSSGMGGGAGAYTYKELCCREFGDLSGKKWEIHVAPPSCSPSNYGDGADFGFFGWLGCKSFITGFGLCNFCAEGGTRGWSLCYLSDGWFMCSGGNDGVRCQASGGWSGSAGQSVNSVDCGPHIAACGFSQFSLGTEVGWRDGSYGYQFPGNDYGKFNKSNRNECEWDLFDDGYLNKKYRVGLGNTFGSQCGRVNPNFQTLQFCYGQTTYLRTGLGQCSHWYGGDGGQHGLPPMYGSPCNYDMGNSCMARNYVPFPGGLINDRGGYIIHRTNAMMCCGPDCCFCQTNKVCMKFQICAQTTAFGLTGKGSCLYEDQATVPGQGGWGSFSQSCMTPNGQTFSRTGAPGQVIITYY